MLIFLSRETRGFFIFAGAKEGMKFFTKDHEWVEVHGDIATIGITDFAQKQLGDIVSIELPKTGDSFELGGALAIVDSMKASSDVYSPISGEVTESNTALLNNPQWINEEPYGKGWIAKIRIKNRHELDNLMSHEQYQKHIGEQK